MPVKSLGVKKEEGVSKLTLDTLISSQAKSLELAEDANQKVLQLGNEVEGKASATNLGPVFNYGGEAINDTKNAELASLHPPENYVLGSDLFVINIDDSDSCRVLRRLVDSSGTPVWRNV